MKRWKRMATHVLILAIVGLAAMISVAHANGERRTSGDGGTIEAWPDEGVVAAYIKLDSGWEAFSCAVVMPEHGWITSGVANPFPEEISAARVCEWKWLEGQSPPAPASSATPAPSGSPITEVASGGYREFGPGAETRPGEGHTWTITVDNGMVLLVGGYEVNGRDRGVYMALAGPQTVTLRVTDGFVQLVRADIANEEFCRRVNQARRSNWALTYVEPLPHWAAC